MVGGEGNNVFYTLCKVSTSIYYKKFSDEGISPVGHCPVESWFPGLSVKGRQTGLLGCLALLIVKDVHLGKIGTSVDKLAKWKKMCKYSYN